MKLSISLVLVSVALAPATVFAAPHSASTPARLRLRDVKGRSPDFWSSIGSALGSAASALDSDTTVDGCQVVECSAALLGTGFSCLGAIVQGGANPIADLECIAEGLKAAKEVPSDCANCPQAIEKELQ
ncbi:hypothetical protein BX600DRAFT_552035 [Xylariales sp. PMI_506]|nr:hypothetical protein BX600DRAFT_552035 [Xylariales sp. PMI_506]